MTRSTELPGRTTPYLIAEVRPQVGGILQKRLFDQGGRYWTFAPVISLPIFTGKPLTEVREVPVKAANIPHERYSPTEPLSVGMPQIGTKHLTEADMWGATPIDQMLCRIAFEELRYEGMFTAPGTDAALNFPGALGGMNWGSLSSDPVNDLVFVNDLRVPLKIRLVPLDQVKDTGTKASESINASDAPTPMKGTPYAVSKMFFMSPLGIPCQAPPYGTLTAISLKTQKAVWQVPVGTVEDTGPFGIKMRLPIPIGMPTLGGTLSTQGGLVFIAGTQDYYLRAFDSATGKEVWKARLPIGSQGGPMTYLSPKTGKQYIVITAGGGRQSPDRGDYVIAYALPDK
ncbi:PQQ-binding-like beta-propeller repeat protein [Yersinia enterocolitica]|nr:PQQ-binding-like beta-propeller repeat protein [Yersinia enterocolitica]